MKIVFLGNSEFSVEVLKSLIASEHKVLCAFGSLDKESGRGHKVVFSPLKSFCLKNGIDYHSCKSISKDGFETLTQYHPDVLVTASFSHILRENVLSFAKYGVINVHTSLLPKYRGSCPVNWVIINGEKQTGITIMQTIKALDAGDILCQKKIPISPDETAGELLSRLSLLSGEVLVKTLTDLENGKAKFTKQDESKSSYFPMLSKEMAKIDFNMTASQIQNFCNGLNPWPVAYFVLDEAMYKVYKAYPIQNKWDIDLSSFDNGQVVMSSPKSGLVVKCSNGLVLLASIQAPNGKVMESRAYLNGKKIPVGTRL